MAWLLYAFTIIVSVVQADTTQCTLLSQENDITAICNNLQLRSVSPSVPDNVTRLYLSHNKMSNISSLSFRRFHALQILDLSYNFISHLDMTVFAHLEELQELNLTHNNISDMTCHNRVTAVTSHTQTILTKDLPANDSDSNNKNHIFRVENNQSVLKKLRVLRLDNNTITSLKTGCFSGLSSLKMLTLSHNLLETIQDDTFQGLTQLEMLSLDSNRLRRLEQRAFKELTHLQILHLASNKLQYKETSLPPGVFAPVGDTLKSLLFHDNDIDEFYGGNYPDTVFMDLSALETLTIDTFTKSTFGKGFAAMHQLTTLDLSASQCRLRVITNQTFIGFANVSLQNLLIDGCNKLIIVEVCSFCPFKHLTQLYLNGSQNHIADLQHYLGAFYGLQYRNLSTVNLGNGSYDAPLGVTLNRRSMKFVLNTCVRSLNLRQNQIVSIGKGGLWRKGSLFTECIESIDLSDNRIWYVDLFLFLQSIRFSPKLESIQGQLQRVFNLEEAHFSMSNRKAEDRDVGFKIGFQIRFTATLSFLNLSSAFHSLGHFPDRIAIENSKNLRTVDLSYVHLYNCLTKFEGFDGLEVFNISGNDCRNTSESFFDVFPSLKVLILQKMNFDSIFIVTQGARIFNNLTHLEILDLSYNDLDMMPSDLLHAQTELHELLLAGNKLGRLSLDIGHLGNMTVLDLSDNAISQLNDTERSSLDGLVAEQLQPFHLRLHGNPLACTCSTLSFIRWLHFTRIRLDQDGDYPCVTDSGDFSSTATVAHNLELAWRHCVGPTALWAAVSGMLVLLSLMGAVWGLAANATRLQFLFNVFRHIKMPRRDQFQKDAYIAYCDADTEYVCTRLKPELQDQRGVRLLIKDLPQDEAGTQFWQLPGDNVAEKMLDHIDLCWKVLLVLTPALAHDPMVGFMTRAVLQSISDRMPDRVLLLCVGIRDMPNLASLRALVDTVSENHVFFVPAEADQHHPAWDRMADVIRN